MNETSIGWIKAFKSFVVKQVNPKFKEYNKPFLLAVIVGTITLGLTSVLFWMMANQCNDVTVSDAQNNFEDKLTPCRCILSTATLGIDRCNMALETRYCLYTKEYSDKISIDNYCQNRGYMVGLVRSTGDAAASSGSAAASGAADAVAADSVAADVVAADAVAADAVVAGAMDDGGAVASGPSVGVGCFDADTISVSSGWRQAEAHGTDVPICAGDTLYHGVCEMCPSKLTTFGAALGYSGFIELVVTVPLVFVLLKCGCLQGGERGHLGQMVKEIFQSTRGDVEDNGEGCLATGVLPASLPVGNPSSAWS